MSVYKEVLDACPDATVSGGKVYAVVDGKNVLIAWPDGKGGLEKSEALDALIEHQSAAKASKSKKAKPAKK